MKLKKIIYTILLLILMIIIFMFSNQNAKTSQDTSDKVASDIVNTVEIVTKKDIPSTKKHDFIDNTRFIVRKTAHFTLYLVLGILAYFTFKSYGISKPVTYSIIFCLLYACCDEVHQMFSDGRTAKVFDVFIDTCGSIAGNGLCLIIFHKRNK